MMRFDNEPVPHLRRAPKSEIEDFFRAEQPLRLGRTTLELASVPSYREPGIIFGGRASARCEITEEDSAQELVTDVFATVPSILHSWLQARFGGRGEDTETIGYVGYEAWEVPSPVAELA